MSSFSNTRRHSRFPLVGRTQAQLLTGGMRTQIICHAVDISQHGMGITTTVEIPKGAEVLLSIKGIEVPMVAKWCQEQPGSEPCFRVGLGTKQSNLNLEDLFYAFRSDRTKEWSSTDKSVVSELNGTMIRASRLPVNGNMVVLARTFGILGDFRMYVANVSRSGLLLLSPDGERNVPFALNTLLELTIDADLKWVPTQIKCIGKVVRIDKGQVTDEDVAVLGKFDSFGVQLTELDEKSVSLWDQCLDRLSKQKP